MTSASLASSAACCRVPPWRKSAREILITRHPQSLANSAVPSVEAESMTMTLDGRNVCASKLDQNCFQMALASRVGMQTQSLIFPWALVVQEGTRARAQRHIAKLLESKHREGPFLQRLPENSMSTNLWTLVFF